MSVSQIKDIDVKCPKGHSFNIPKENWNHENVEVEDKFEQGMGNEVHHQYSVEDYPCPQCSTKIDASVDIWEYPNGDIEMSGKSTNVVSNVDDSFFAELD